MIEIRTGNKTGVVLDTYNNKYSIASVSDDKDGTWRKEWARKQVGKDKLAEKATPIKVYLGEKETAIAALQQLIQEIQGTDDIPF